MNRIYFGLLALSIALSSCSSTTTPANNPGISGTLYYNTLSELHKVNLATDKVTNISNTRGSNVLADGRILTVADNGLAIISADGAQTQIIVKQQHDVPFNITFDDFFHDPQLSPDKLSIAYDDGKVSPMCYVVDLSGTLLWTIGDPTPNATARYERPVWGKDGSLYVQGKQTFNNGIFKIDKNFQTIKRIDPSLTAVAMPSVSPDGTTIAFVVNSDIWLMNTDGSNARALTTGKLSLTYPTWSPDGKWIACLGPAFDIFFLPTAGGTIVMSSTAAPNLKSDEAIGGFEMDWK